MEDTLRIGSHTFHSRLFVGTGKYRDVAETRDALEASGARWDRRGPPGGSVEAPGSITARVPP